MKSIVMYYFCRFKVVIFMLGCCLETVSFAAIEEILYSKRLQKISFDINVGILALGKKKFQSHSIVQEREATM